MTRCSRLFGLVSLAQVSLAHITNVDRGQEFLKSAKAEYDYSDILQYYCHPTLDWGSIPRKPEGATDLLQVQVFIRHGARTQATFSPLFEGDREGNFTCGLNYLYNSADTHSTGLTPDFRLRYVGGPNPVAGNCLAGQLVEDGFEQERRNGIRLREAYLDREHLLPLTLEGMTERDVDATLYLRSTDVPRTKQSAMALVSGMYDRDALGGNLSYLTLRTMDWGHETMMAKKDACPSMDWREAAYVDALPDETKGELRSLCQEFNPPLAEDFRSCSAWLVRLMDSLMSRLCPTVPFQPRDAVPAKFLDDDSALLRRLWKVVDETQFGKHGAHTEAGAHSAFVGEIHDFAKAAAQGDEAPKFVLYSGHDSGPMMVLYDALDLRPQPPYWPAFGSMLTLEIWNSASGPLVRWISDAQIVVGPTPWDTYKDTLSTVVELGSACFSPAPPTPAPPSEPAPAPTPERIPSVFMMLGAVVVGAVSALVGMRLFHRGRESQPETEMF